MPPVPVDADGKAERILQRERWSHDAGRATPVPDPHAGLEQPGRDQAAPQPAGARPGLARAPCAVALGGGDPVTLERAEQRGVRRRPLRPRARRILERVDQLVAARAVGLTPDGKRLSVRERVIGGGVQAAATPPVQRDHLEREHSRIGPFEAAALAVWPREQHGRGPRQRAHPAGHRQLLAAPEPPHTGEPGEPYLLDRHRAQRVHHDAPLR